VADQRLFDPTSLPMPSGELTRDTIAASPRLPGAAASGIIGSPDRPLSRIASQVAGSLRRHGSRASRASGTLAAERSTRGSFCTLAAPHSYTGEDVLELHGHGGPVVMQMLLGACLERARAWQNRANSRGGHFRGPARSRAGEAVADLIDAASQRRRAARCVR